MKKLIHKSICIILLTLSGIHLSLASALVDINWLQGRIGKPGVVILDVGSPSLAEYLQGHIPGAIYTDFKIKETWRVTNPAGVIETLPEPSHLEKLIGSLGIDNTSEVIIVASGANASDMAIAARIYWTLKVAGHDSISILDGGMSAYVADKKNPLQQGETLAETKTFKAKIRTDIIATRSQVKNALHNTNIQLLDLRPSDFYLGITRSSKNKTAGTIPGAKNLPVPWLTENNGGTMRPVAELKKLYDVANISMDGEQITFCVTGQWASLGWFVAHELLGNKNARLYDGSMADWTHDPALPVERKVVLN